MRPRPALADLRPYEPGKPAADVRRELGLDRIVKLASNEGPYGPFPAALEAIARAARELNRYPERGAELAERLAARHGTTPDRIAISHRAAELEPVRRFVIVLRSKYQLRFLDETSHDLTESVDDQLAYLFGPPS